MGKTISNWLRRLSTGRATLTPPPTTTGTITPTPSVTPTRSATASPTGRATATITATGTITGTPTRTPTPRNTSTSTRTGTPTHTPTITPTPSATRTPQPTLPAGTVGGRIAALDLEHAERGTPSSQASDHFAQLDKRRCKLQSHDYGTRWADVEGDTTAGFIHELLKARNIKVTRLAFGLPAGSGIRYSDPVTLAKAIQGRQQA